MFLNKRVIWDTNSIECKVLLGGESAWLVIDEEAIVIGRERGGRTRTRDRTVLSDGAVHLWPGNDTRWCLGAGRRGEDEDMSKDRTLSSPRLLLYWSGHCLRTAFLKTQYKVISKASILPSCSEWLIFRSFVNIILIFSVQTASRWSRALAYSRPKKIIVGNHSLYQRFQ